MAQKMYRRREVEELTGRKRSALYEDIKSGKFPAPVKIGARAVAWLEADIRAWQAKRIAERDREAVTAHRSTKPAHATV